MSDIVAKIRAEKNSNIDTLILEASNVEIANNIGLILPVGTTSERGTTSRKGAIRFNSNNEAFEGYNGTAWGTLGGVESVDKNTKIIPETYANAQNNQLDFFTNSNHIMRLDDNGDLLFGPDISNNNISITMDNSSGTINLHKLNIVNENDNTKKFSIDISDNNKTIINSTTGAVTVFNNSVEFKVAPTFPAGEGAATTQNIGGGRIYNTIIGYNNLETETGAKSFFTTTKTQQLIIEDKINFYDSAATSYNYPLLSANFHSIDISTNALINGSLTVNNNVSLNSNLNVNGSTTLQDLSCETININSTLDVNGATLLSNNLNVEGDASFNNNVDISGTLNVEGDASFNSNVTIDGKLDIAGELKVKDTNDNYTPGISGEILISQGNNVPPIWKGFSEIHQPDILEIHPLVLYNVGPFDPYSFGTSSKIDTANGWNPSTNKYTIPTSGYWYVASIIGGWTNGSANFYHSIVRYNSLTETISYIAEGRALFTDFGGTQFETTGNDATTIRYLNSGDEIWFRIYQISSGFFGDGGRTECGFRAYFLRT